MTRHAGVAPVEVALEPVDEPLWIASMAELTAPAAGLPAALAVPVLVWAFWVGACVGSFLNVVIARLPEGVSIVTPRSRCPRCSTEIGWRDNVPLVSWILLRAKCRACAAPISARYPFVELLLGVAAVAVALRWGLSLQGLEVFAFLAILVAVAFIDIDTWTIPYSLVVALLVTGFGFGALRAAVEPPPPIDLALSGAVGAVDGGVVATLVDRAIGAFGALIVLGAVVVVFTWLFRKTGRLAADQTAMGWGDPLLLAGIGAVLGWRVLPIVLFLASLQGAVVGIALRLTGRIHQGDEPVSDDDDWVPPRSSVPFGPFLALGAIEIAFFGDALLEELRALLGAG